MITWYIWKNVVWEDFKLWKELELMNIFLCTCFNIITIPIDIILSPLEIISLIIFKIMENNNDKTS